MIPPTPAQRRNTICVLKAEHSKQLKIEKALAFANRPPCPYCAQKHVYSVGVKSQIKHYRCSKCRKSFSARTGTSEYWIHKKESFRHYMTDMLSNGHKTLKQMCSEYNISSLTAFDWRHKVLASLNCNQENFNGLIELRNSIFKLSWKGSRKSVNDFELSNVHIIVSADHNKNTALSMVRIGNLKTSDLEAHLNFNFGENPVVVGRYQISFHDFSKKRNLGATFFSKTNNPHELDDKMSEEIENDLRFLVQNKAHGVSTKYLNNYIQWLLFVKSKKSITMHGAHPAWFNFTGTEHSFKQFFNCFSDMPYFRTSFRIWKKSTETIASSSIKNRLTISS